MQNIFSMISQITELLFKNNSACYDVMIVFTTFFIWYSTPLHYKAGRLFFIFAIISSYLISVFNNHIIYHIIFIICSLHIFPINQMFLNCFIQSKVSIINMLYIYFSVNLILLAHNKFYSTYLIYLACYNICGCILIRIIHLMKSQIHYSLLNVFYQHMSIILYMIHTRLFSFAFLTTYIVCSTILFMMMQYRYPHYSKIISSQDDLLCSFFTKNLKLISIKFFKIKNCCSFRIYPLVSALEISIPLMIVVMLIITTLSIIYKSCL